ncbi:MAG: hypothetical protein NPIRA02_11490 [Nitrospirales bacterium]|nr:MAG: hypothetical protein NPIRA02_11490 [Nitrospirales bacterium]
MYETQRFKIINLKGAKERVPIGLIEHLQALSVNSWRLTHAVLEFKTRAGERRANLFIL